MASKAPLPVFPRPGPQYDPLNEAQFRQAVEYFMQQTAAFPAAKVGLAEHGLTDHLDVSLAAVSIGDTLEVPSVGAPTGLQRTTSGLLFREDFNDIQGGTKIHNTNGWTDEKAPTTTWTYSAGGVPGSDPSDRAKCGTSALSNLHRTLSHAGDFILQVNVQDSIGSTKWQGLGCRIDSIDGDGQPPNGYYLQRDENGNTWRFTEVTAGAGTHRITQAETINDESKQGMRIVGEVSGSNMLFRIYRANLSSIDDLSVDFTQLGSQWSDTSPHTGSILSIRAETIDDLFDEFIICGRNIVVNGIPTGYKVKVDSRTAVVSTGLPVVIDVDTWAFPATTIQVLDGSDNPVGDPLTPSGGIFGGDVYNAISGDAIWVNRPAMRDIGGVSGSFTITFSDAKNQFVNVTADVATTISLGGEVVGLETDLILRNGSGGALTPGNFTWDSAIVWDGGTAPTLPANGDAIEIRFKCLSATQTIGKVVASLAGISDI